MGRDDLCINVPSFFRCPITLDVMKSPVSLCTGVTYDRASIQRWLDSGNNTCPATMQVLHTKDVVPNLTLQRLIQIWSDSLSAHRRRSDPPPNTLTQNEALQLIKTLSSNTQSVSKLIGFAKESDQNRKFLAGADGLIDGLIHVLANLKLFPPGRINSGEQSLILLELISRDRENRAGVAKLVLENEDRVVSSMQLVLRHGNLASQRATARVLEYVAAESGPKLCLREPNDLFSEMIRLMSLSDKSASNPDLIQSILSAVICISKQRRVRSRLIDLGIVKVLGKLLSDPNSSVPANESAIRFLEMATSCKEGRERICEDDGGCVSAIVKMMLKVSTATTEHSVAILWSLCYLFRDKAAQEAVGRSNGMTKVLLLMQSNCSPAVKQMAGDLLKIFRVNSKSCLASYDTKTTHIMPF